MKGKASRQRAVCRTMKNPKVIDVLFVRDESEFSQSAVEETKNLIAQMILLGQEDQSKKDYQRKLKGKQPFDPREVTASFEQKPAPKLLKSVARVRAENGEPLFPISELCYPIDFVPKTFENRLLFPVSTARNIAERYRSGESLGDLARLHSCSKSKIRSHLEEVGVKLRESKPPSTPARVRDQQSHGARPYYGFCVIDGLISRDPREFKTLVLIYELWSRKRTIHQITQALNKSGLPSRLGRKWSWAATRGIVQRFEDGSLVIKKGGKYEFR